MRKLLSVLVISLSSVSVVEAREYRVTVFPPTISGIERPPVADYTPKPTWQVRRFPAQVIEMYEEAPPNGCASNAFAEIVAPGIQRCFGK